MTTQRFRATIVKSETRTHIVLPFDPNSVWGVKQRHYITGAVNGCQVRGPLASDRQQYFLPLGAAWRQSSALAEGDDVEVVLAPEGPQLAHLAPDVAGALEAEPRAKAFFESLATFYRNTYINWIESARRPATRAARIQEMVALLKAGQKQK